MSLRNFCTVSDTAPSEIRHQRYDASGNTIDTEDGIIVRPPQNGDLWVDSTNFTMNVFSSVAYNATDDTGEVNPRKGWVGVTDRSQKGSIVYFSSTVPTLFDIFPSLNTLPRDIADDIQGDILPGTMWYDTSTYMLKLYIAGADGNGSWIAVTSANYLTQAVSEGLADMEIKVAALEAQLAALQNP